MTTTLRFDVTDLTGEPVGAGHPLIGEVVIRYDRPLEAGGKVVSPAARRFPIPASGVVDVPVWAADDPLITRGGGVKVIAELDLLGRTNGPNRRHDVRPLGSRSVSTGSGAGPVSWTTLEDDFEPVLPTVKPSALSRISAIKQVGAGKCVVAVASDSTGNDPTDWVRLWHQKYGALVPSNVRRVYKSWNATTSVWNAETVDAAGTAASLGVIVDDSFTRSGEIVGSTPTTSGPNWGGTAGIWTADGDEARAGTTFGNISQNLASRDQSATATLNVVTTVPSVAQSFRIYSGAGGAGTGVWAMLSLTTAGALTVQLWKSLPTNTSLSAAVPIAGSVSNSGTPQVVTMKVSTVVQAAYVEVTCGGQTTRIDATITEADVTARGNSCYIGGGGAGGTFFAALDHIRIQTPAADNPPPTPELSVWNGSIAGGTLGTFDAAKRAAMWGGASPDVMILSVSHNHGGEIPSIFVDRVAAWVDAVKAEHPNIAFLISSQNPQYPPAGGIAAHQERIAALRDWADTQGYDYLSAFEAFTGYSGGGSSLVIADGVHPTTPPSGLTGAYGSVVWADRLVTQLG